jgi:hypothetical protein
MYGRCRVKAMQMYSKSYLVALDPLLFDFSASHSRYFDSSIMY